MSTSGEATVINDRYEIHKRVGRGGMADVFLARDLLLDRQVAIKVLFPEFAIDPNFVERFRREAQAAANLSHPNIVSVYDWGKHSGTYFIAMEYVEGRTLAEVLKTNRQLTSKQAAEIASEVAAALGFAHEAGLAHRDIKPANILIGSNGQVKVADFGIARAMNATDSNLTQAGAVMGTASYFSPEQAQGAQPDPRSDLYSLGIVMYEMVAGRPPFTGENPVSIAYKQVHDQPEPLNRIVADIPRPFEAIVAKLLAKDPKLRYPSAHALRDDLRRFRNGEQVQALVAAVAGNAARTPPPPTSASAAMTRVGPSQPPVGATTAMPRTGQQPAMTGYPPGASPDARYYDDGPSRAGWYALAAFIALIALAAGGVLLYQALSEEDAASESITLPDFTNTSLDNVITALDALGLVPEPIPEENATVPDDFVHRTDPVAGTLVRENEIVTLYFNPSPELQVVPNVEGESLESARDILSRAGFQVVDTTEESDVEAGTVIRTEPAAGEKVEQTTQITIVVSSGPRGYAVPGIVVGNSEADARALLEAEPYLFTVETQSQQSDEEPGTVLAIAPEPNTLLPPGSTVTLTVSSGPGQVIVPPVVGRPEGEARNQLAAEDLDASVTYVDVEPGSSDDGLVISQSVAAGASVDRGTVVALEVGRATAPATTTSTTTTTTTTLPPETTVAPDPTTTVAAGG